MIWMTATMPMMVMMIECIFRQIACYIFKRIATSAILHERRAFIGESLMREY